MKLFLVCFAVFMVVAMVGVVVAFITNDWSK
jgi:hypothetical protein